MSNVKIGDRVRLTDPINKGKIAVVEEIHNDGYAVLNNLDGTFDCITNCFELANDINVGSK